MNGADPHRGLGVEREGKDIAESEARLQAQGLHLHGRPRFEPAPL